MEMKFGNLLSIIAVIVLFANKPVSGFAAVDCGDSLSCVVDSFLSRKNNDGIRRVTEGIIFNYDKELRKALSNRIYSSGVERQDYLRIVYGSCLVGANHLFSNADADTVLFYLNTCLTYKDKLDSVAIRGHEWIVANAYNTLGLFYMNFIIDYPKAVECFFKALQFFDEADYSDLYAIVLANLSVVHYIISDSTGLQYARMLKDYTERKPSPYSNFLSEYSLAQMHYVCGNYEEALGFVERALGLREHHDVKSVKYDVATDVLYARILLAVGECGKAVSILKNAISIASENSTTEMIEAALVLGNWYVSVGDFEPAEKLYIDVCKMFDQPNLKLWEDYVMLRMSNVYERMGDYEAALAYYKRYHDISDSNFNASKDYRLSELKVKYNVAQYENDVKTHQVMMMKAEKQRQVWIFLFISLLITAGGGFVYYRNKNKYYKRIVRQYRENIMLNRQNEELERRQLYSHSSLSKSKGEELYGCVKSMMDEKRVYRDNSLTADKLATMLQTNRTYLSQVINEYSGMNFSRYINHLRIKDAIETLSEPGNQIMMKALAADVGFKTVAAFSKAFSEETGVSPSVFRKKSMELDKRKEIG